MSDLSRDLRAWAAWLESRSFASLDGTKARLAADEIEWLQAENAVRVRELQDEIDPFLWLLFRWLRSLVPPQTLAAVVRKLDEEIKRESEANSESTIHGCT